MRVAAVTALCVLATGCGTAGLRAHSPNGPKLVVAPGIVRTRGATYAGNRAAARAEAKRLLALTRLPAGATRLSRVPRFPDGPALGIPGVGTLAHLVRTWTVHSPLPVVRAWLLAHAPHGLPVAGTAFRGEGTRPDQTSGIGYGAPASPAWQSADLEIGFASARGDTTVIRADALVVWLDPRPIRSRPGIHPIRVTLASGCPSSDAHVTGVTNPGVKLTRRLLPPGQPTAGLRCRYDGTNGRPFQLAATSRLTAQRARQAARRMSAIPLSHTDGGFYNCPMGDGTADILVLAYPGHPDVDLWIYTNGCRSTSNGYISAGVP
jgi:hypothetical protein